MTRHLTAFPLHELLAHLPASTQFKSLRNPDALHTSVMRLFGPVPIGEGEGARSAAGVLFRVEPIVDGQTPFVLIRSKFAPVITTPGMRTGADLPTPEAGTTVSFRLALNAVRFNRNSGPTNSRTAGAVPVGEEDIADYTADRLAGMDDIAVLNHARTVIGTKGNGRSPVQIDMIDGIARVIEPIGLERQLAGGVGRAKNFGCGLLTVRAI